MAGRRSAMRVCLLLLISQLCLRANAVDIASFAKKAYSAAKDSSIINGLRNDATVKAGVEKVSEGVKELQSAVGEDSKRRTQARPAKTGKAVRDAEDTPAHAYTEPSSLDYLAEEWLGPDGAHTARSVAREARRVVDEALPAADDAIRAAGRAAAGTARDAANTVRQAIGSLSSEAVALYTWATVTILVAKVAASYLLLHCALHGTLAVLDAMVTGVVTTYNRVRSRGQGDKRAGVSWAPARGTDPYPLPPSALVAAALVVAASTQLPATDDGQGKHQTIDARALRLAGWTLTTAACHVWLQRRDSAGGRPMVLHVRVAVSSVALLCVMFTSRVASQLETAHPALSKLSAIDQVLSNGGSDGGLGRLVLGLLGLDAIVPGPVSVSRAAINAAAWLLPGGDIISSQIAAAARLILGIHAISRYGGALAFAWCLVYHSELVRDVLHGLRRLFLGSNDVPRRTFGSVVQDEAGTQAGHAHVE